MSNVTEIKRKNQLIDTLRYLDRETVTNTTLANGVITGVVGTLMALGMDFDEAITIVAKYSPKHNFNWLAVPDPWMDALRREKNPEGENE